MALTIVEILGRSKQGMTKPYICKCDDGEVYFAKGRSVTRHGLINEWLCARLGHAFGLPIAPFEKATVPQEFIDADLTGWLSELGSGEVFVSKKINAVDFNKVHLTLVPANVRRDVIAFDWWIRNGDRNLTAMGGNPNLLWNPVGQGELVVIDHNLAFDSSVTGEEFLQHHVFSDDFQAIFNDFILQSEYIGRFTTALSVWDESCASLPKAWLFTDPELTIPANYPFQKIKNLLEEALFNKFWCLPL